MRTCNISSFLASVLLLQSSVARARNEDLGTFKNPSKHARPRFRYWVPDASVDSSQVSRDIANVAKIGGGGIELLGYYNYGDVEVGPGVTGTDWTKYGWGTPAWKQVQDAAIQAASDNDVVIDLTLGPNQGAGVPAEFAADSLQWDLQPFNTSVKIGGRFNAVLPGWGIGKLCSASTGLVVSNNNGTQVLSAASLQDVTDHVKPNGELNITFPSNVKGNNYVVFAYYLVHSDLREQQTPELVTSGAGVQQSPVTSYVQNGSWVVDHFSAKGAQAVADFWKRELLSGGSGDLLKTVGGYVWEDSQEYTANVMWTPNMTTKFQANRGYSVKPYIPILLHDNHGPPFLPYKANEIYITDEPDAGARHVADYRQTLTELNAEYVKGLTEFAHSIGLQSSAQIVYNLPMDMLANVPLVDAPELESLGFLSSNTIDGYRQYAGPASLAKKQILSSECGADLGSAYQQFIPHLLSEIKLSIAGGVNAFVLHGMPYSGNYVNTTWPSYTTFSYEFSEMHGRHQPAFDFYRDWVDYVSRLMYTMQSGTPKVDVAFWLKNTTYNTVNPSYKSDDLATAGYTYEYLSPDDFSLPAATVDDGVLAPTAQAFKALVVRQTDLITPFGVDRLNDFAQKGLPILFAGGLPFNTSGTVTRAENTKMKTTLHGLKSLSNVHIVSATNVAQSLASIGVQPRAKMSGSSSSPWYTRWRESSDETFVYVFNTGVRDQAGNKTITFQSSGTPYLYNAWTGEQTAIVQYTRGNDNTTTVPISLMGDDATVIAFKSSVDTPVCVESVSSPVTVRQQLVNRKQRPVLVAGSKTPTTANLSNGTSINLPQANLSPIPLTNWGLTIESWGPPAASDLFDVEATIKKNSTYKIKSLEPWDKLNVGTNLSYISGRGYYTTSFTWPPSGTCLDEKGSPSSGAVLTMSGIVHTAVLFVNGIRMPPIDFLAPDIDITHVLKPGKNTVKVIVSTPLGNAMIPIMSQLLTGGARVPDGPFFQQQHYGLVGTVVVTPYSGVALD